MPIHELVGTKQSEELHNMYVFTEIIIKLEENFRMSLFNHLAYLINISSKNHLI